MTYLNATHACPAFTVDGRDYGQQQLINERWEPCQFVCVTVLSGQTAYVYRELSPNIFGVIGTFHTYEPLPEWGVAL